MHSTQSQTAPQHIIPRPSLLVASAHLLLCPLLCPAQALPPTPPIAHSYPAQAVSSRPQNPAPGSAVQAHPLPVGYAQQNNVYSHPYSPHPYASNVTPKPHPSRDPNDAAYPATSNKLSPVFSSSTTRLASPSSQITVNPSPPLLRLPPTRSYSPRVSVSASRCPQQRQTIIPISHSPVPLPNSVLGGSEIPGWDLCPPCPRGAISLQISRQLPATGQILPIRIPP